MKKAIQTIKDKLVKQLSECRVYVECEYHQGTPKLYNIYGFDGIKQITLGFSEIKIWHTFKDGKQIENQVSLLDQGYAIEGYDSLATELHHCMEQQFIFLADKY